MKKIIDSLLSIIQYLKKFLFFRRFFGDDVFISYSHIDSIKFGLTLANKLADKGYQIYIDQFTSSSPGQKISSAIKKRIKKSSSMIVIGSAGAINSDAIEEEIKDFTGAGDRKPVKCINVDNNFFKAKWFYLLRGLPNTRVSLKDFEENNITEDALNDIIISLDFTKKSSVLKGVSIAVFILILFSFTLAVAFSIAASHAEEKRKFTEEQLEQTQFKNQVAEKSLGQLELEKVNLNTQNKNLETQKSNLLFSSDKLRRDSTMLANQNKELTTQSTELEKKAETLQNQTNQLNGQNKMMDFRISAKDYLDKDPVISFRLAQLAYDLSPDSSSRALILASISRIDLYYKELIQNYTIEDFKEPYILLSEKSTNDTIKSLAVFNSITNEINKVEIKADDVWIIPMGNNFRFLTLNWQRKKVKSIGEYCLLDRNGYSISEFSQGHRMRFISPGKILLNQDDENSAVIWDLVINSKEAISLADLKINRADFVYGVLGMRQDGISAIHYKDGVVLLNLDGNIDTNSYTEIPIDPAFTDGYWSNDNKYLALSNPHNQRLGIWNVSKKSFMWLDSDDWLVNSFSWSLDGHLLAFSGHMDNQTNYTIEVVDAEEPEKSKNLVYKGNVPIDEIVFLPQDEKIAIVDRKSNLSIIKLSTSEILQYGYHEDINKLYSTKNAFYTTSKNDFRVWNVESAPSKHWLFKSDKFKLYQPIGIFDSTSSSLKVVYLNLKDSLMHIESREVFSNLSKDQIKNIDNDINFGPSDILNSNRTYDEIANWKTSELFSYNSRLIAKISNGWVFYAKCRDRPLSSVNHDCDLEFILTNIQDLIQIYDEIVWKPTEQELKKIVNLK
jgi:hypothetical protein